MVKLLVKCAPWLPGQNISTRRCDDGLACPVNGRLVNVPSNHVSAGQTRAAGQNCASAARQCMANTCSLRQAAAGQTAGQTLGQIWWCSTRQVGLYAQCYLCQWAPVTCVGFLLVTLGTVGALNSFEFFKSCLPALTTDWQWNSKPKKLPSQCRHAHAFWILSWNSLLDPPLFSFIILLHKWQVSPSIGDYENSSPLLWNRRYSEKGNLPDPFVSTFSFVMPFSNESEYTKLMTSLIINL